MRLSAKTIAKAKREASGTTLSSFHEHDDCIRIAYEWLDAQNKLLSPCYTEVVLKSVIEHWAGRYVSQDDVEVAAHIHPEICGTYPNYNFGARLVKPSYARLKKIGEAHTQDYNEERPGTYSILEDNELVLC